MIPATRSIVRQEGGWRGHCISTGWMSVVLNLRFDWRLTAFHASHFQVDSVNSFKNFLHTHSPTLRDLTISDVIVDDPRHGAETNLIAKGFWTEIFQIILDGMSLRKGKFHDLLSLIRGKPCHYASVAMYWDQNNGLELDLYGRKFEEVAMVRGVTRTLTDWKNGMVMGEVPERHSFGPSLSMRNSLLDGGDCTEVLLRHENVGEKSEPALFGLLLLFYHGD